MIKKKIIIKGEKVHHVGYRPFLLAKALELDIPNYFARNLKENGMEIIEVSIGGREEQVNELVDFIKNNYSPEANVSDVREGKPPERIMPIEKYDSVLSSEQQSTIVQAGLGMIGMQKETIGLQKQTIKEVKTVGEKIDNFAKETKGEFTTLRGDYGKISKTMEKILEQMSQQQKEFTDAINGLTKAILALAEKRS